MIMAVRDAVHALQPRPGRGTEPELVAGEPPVVGHVPVRGDARVLACTPHLTVCVCLRHRVARRRSGGSRADKRTPASCDEADTSVPLDISNPEVVAWQAAFGASATQVGGCCTK